MRLNIFIIALLALFTGNVMAADLPIPDDKVVIQFETKIGVVTFAHQKHADLSITQCITCHHEIKPTDTVVQPCHDCHKHKAKAKEEPAKTKVAFHKRCTGCHEYTVAGGQHAGPLKKKCKLCHIKQ